MHCDSLRTSLLCAFTRRLVKVSSVRHHDAGRCIISSLRPKRCRAGVDCARAILESSESACQVCDTVLTKK